MRGYPEHLHELINEDLQESIYDETLEEEKKMTNLLKEKYTNALEIIEETGKLLMENIDDGDLEGLQDELKKLGFNSYIDSSTNYLIID